MGRRCRWRAACRLDRSGAPADEAFPKVYAAVAARMLGARVVMRRPDGREAHFGTRRLPVLELTTDQRPPARTGHNDPTAMTS